MDSEKKIQELIGLVRESKNIVFFGGAGVSTESGIPDFRSSDGLYRMKSAVPPEVILSAEFFERHPEDFYAFYRERMMPLDKKPNVVHKKLAEWEAEGKLRAVVTQNIDGLHQIAGSKTVYELHGSIYRYHCSRCRKKYGIEIMLSTKGVPKCSCGGIVKPDVVLYGEPLDGAVIDGALKAIANSDLMIVAGTSLTVYPAAGLVNYAAGKLVLVNRDETSYDTKCDLVLHEKLGEVFSRL